MSDTKQPAPPAPHDEAAIALPEPTKLSRGRGVVIIGVTLALLAVAFFAGLLPRLLRRRTLDADASARAQAAPRVEIVTAKAISSDRALELPGTIQPLEETTIYPRAAGYVRRWLVDLGDLVKEGQLLVEIDTPELDAQIEQARADLAQAEAGRLRAETNAKLSSTERTRYETLTPEGVTSQQELEQRRAQAQADEANIKVAAATVASQQANLHRLLQMKSFARVDAPFAGTIISRTVERGTLVSAGTGTPLFRLAASDPVRVFINVPQNVAPSIRSNIPATVSVREYGDRRFAGKVARSAGALDEATRTMRTEVQVPNPRRELLPGMYVRVALTLPIPHQLLEVPATALFSDGQGTRLAIVDAQGKVSMRPVVIERDTGKAIEVAAGLDGSERIVRIANAALGPGSAVEIIAASPADRSAEADKK